MTLSIFLERNPHLEPCTALIAWNAALEAARELTEERAEHWHAKSHLFNNFDAEHAGAKWLEGRQLVTTLDTLKARNV